MSSLSYGEGMEELKYGVLLDEVQWDYDQKVYPDYQEFYLALKNYNKELDQDINEEILYRLNFKKVNIEFNYAEKVNGEWVDVRKRFEIESSQEVFNELELLYLLNNAIYHLFRNYNHIHHEGLELIESTKELTYELMLGS